VPRAPVTPFVSSLGAPRPEGVFGPSRPASAFGPPRSVKPFGASSAPAPASTPMSTDARNEPAAAASPAAAEHRARQTTARIASISPSPRDRHPEYAHEASIVVDPSLQLQGAAFTGIAADAPPRSPVAPSSSSYQPLPSDPAAFEQLMREQAAARGSRLNWKQQATLVIPREALSGPSGSRLPSPKLALLLAASLIAGALGMLAFRHLGGSPDVATDTRASTASASGAASTTVIATEPSGAELLLDGAVVGDTPLQVVRPRAANTEHVYIIRMRGFGQEQVRLKADSQQAIRVTLRPE